MPELPDLEVFSENIMKALDNKAVEFITVNNPAKVIMQQENMQNAWIGTCIREVIRNGKELYFHSESGQVFSVHLMLNGRFDIVFPSDKKQIPFKIMTIGFCGDTELIISDFQDLCRVTFNPSEPSAHDALSEEFSYEYFLDAIRKSARKNIKAFLINQDTVRGIGNAYADEILYVSGISPESTAGKIPQEYLRRLYDSIPLVLNEAVQSIRKISPDIIGGEERSFLRVHNPHKKRTDKDEEIIIKKVASKTTFFTANQLVFK